MSYDAIRERIKIREFEEREGERPERIFKLYFYQEVCICRVIIHTIYIIIIDVKIENRVSCREGCLYKEGDQ